MRTQLVTIDMEKGEGDIYLAYKNSSKIVHDNINATVIMSTYNTLVPVDVSWADEPLHCDNGAFFSGHSVMVSG